MILLRKEMYGYQGNQQQGPIHPGAPQQAELMQWFQAVDQDRSGKITADELKQALAAGNGASFSLEACAMLIKLFDRDHSKKVDFQGFSQLFHFVNQWRASFSMYDRDRSCSIDAGELGQALQHMGYRLSQQTVNSLIAKFSSNIHHGQITFDSFIMACVQLQQLTSIRAFSITF